MTQDQELFSFAAQVLEENGGVVETRPDGFLALLPDRLSQGLHLPEEVRFGEEGVPLLYGSPMLDQLVGLLTHDVPVAYGQLNVPYLKQAGFEQLLSQDLSFGKVRLQITKWEEARTTYMILLCHYLAMGDERKEGLVPVAVHEDNGAVVADFPSRWQDFQPEFFPLNEMPPHFSFHTESSVRAAMKGARVLAEHELSDFIKSIGRHLNRDIRNTREYYEALQKEMQASLENPHLSEEQRSERGAKIAELPDEMERKIEDLKQKYQTHVTITGCAALRFLVPVIRLTVDIHFRKLLRQVRVIYNPLMHHLDPLVCEHCRETIREIHAVEKKEEIALYCAQCSKK